MAGLRESMGLYTHCFKDRLRLHAFIMVLLFSYAISTLTGDQLRRAEGRSVYDEKVEEERGYRIVIDTRLNQLNIGHS